MLHHVVLRVLADKALCSECFDSILCDIPFSVISQCISRALRCSPSQRDHIEAQHEKLCQTMLSRVHVRSAPPLLDSHLFKTFPSMHRRSPWQRVYSAAQHGMNCRTMLGRVRGRSPLFLVIKDHNHHVFGAFLPFQLENRVSSDYLLAVVNVNVHFSAPPPV